jgi:hypothetical protein
VAPHGSRHLNPCGVTKVETATSTTPYSGWCDHPPVSAVLGDSMARMVQADDDVVRLSFIGSIVRRRWRLLAVLALCGALAGYGASWLVSPGYVATSKVLLQDAANEEALLTEVQIAISQVVLDRTATGLGMAGGIELRGDVTAAVVDGNVIQVSGVAPTQELALALTDRVTAEYVAFSTELVNDTTNAATTVLQDRRETVVGRIDDTAARIAELQGSPLLAQDTPEGARVRAELDQLGRVLNDANLELDDIDGREVEAEAESAASRSAIGVLEPAVPGGAADPTPVQLAAGGGVLFALLGLFALIAATRTDRRLRGPDEIATALGAPLLASVDVLVAPGHPAHGAGPGGRRPSVPARLAALFRDDAGWDADGSVPVDRSSEAVRYRRALTRLRRGSGANLRVLVLVPEDDPVALAAVGPLAAAASADGALVTVVTDRADLGEIVAVAARRTPHDGRLVTVRDTTRADPRAPGAELSVVDVAIARPTVPENPGAHGVIVVTSAGTRTAWELVGVAGACVDAGHPVLGVLVVSAVPAAGPGENPPPDAPEPVAHLNGSRPNGTMTAGSV